MAWAQAWNNLDSLLKAKSPNNDCDKAILESRLAYAFSRSGQPDTAHFLAEKHMVGACPEAREIALRVAADLKFTHYHTRQADSLNNQALEVAEQLNDSIFLIQAYFRRAQIASIEGRHTDVEPWIRLPIKYYLNKQAKQPAYIMAVDLLINAQHALGNYEALTQICQEFYDYGKLNQNADAMATGQYYLATAAFENKNEDQAIKHNRLALAHAPDAKDATTLIGIYALFQQLYDSKQQFDSVVFCLRIMDQLVDKMDFGQQMWQHTNWANFYYSRGQFENSLKHCDTIFSGAKTAFVYPLVVHFSHSVAGRSHFELADYGKALSHLRKAFWFYKNQKVHEEYLLLMPQLIGSFAYLGMADSAAHFVQFFSDRKDSLYSAENLAKLNELEVKYQIKEKELQIEDAKADLAQQQRIQNQQRVIIIIGSFGLLLISILALLAYRGLQRSRRAEKIIAERNAQIEAKNEENVLLLREIHHRVKNNMQIINSLLDLQVLQNDQQHAGEALLSSQNRIRAMALIHEMLYQQEHLAAVKFSEYARKLVENLQTMASKDAEIKAEINAEFDLDIDRAIPLALIINELITNSLKHATPVVNPLRVTLLVARNGDTALIEVRDNGQAFDPNKALDSSGLGMRLAKRLAKQLDAQFNVSSGSDTSFALRFSLTTTTVHG